MTNVITHRGSLRSRSVSTDEHSRKRHIKPHLPTRLLQSTTPMSTPTRARVHPAGAIEFHPPADILDLSALDELFSFLDDFEDYAQLPEARRDGLPSAPCHHTLQDASALRQMPRSYNKTPSSRASAAPKKTRRSRFERYWNKKHELNVLRCEVLHLSNKLELLRQCIRPTQSARPVDIGVRSEEETWKLLADNERNMLERAEEINTKLRALLSLQRQWTTQMWEEFQQFRSQQSKVPQEVKPEPWEQVLAQLIRNACMREGDMYKPNVSLDAKPASCLTSRSDSPSEWSSSFVVPGANPTQMGEAWWRSWILHTPASRPATRSLRFTPLVSRVRRQCVLKLASEADRSHSASMETAFELRQECGLSVIAAFCTVFDESGKCTLFSATSTITFAFTPGNAELCQVQAYTRIHNPLKRQEASLLDDADTNAAIDLWAKVMHKRDRTLKQYLLESALTN